jgi:hypothetical protein
MAIANESFNGIRQSKPPVLAGVIGDLLVA